MNRLTAPLALALFVVAMAAAAQPSAFDGAWKASMKCPATNANEGAKGYAYDFSGQVTGSEMNLVHGAEGQPGFQHLHGRIEADGKATLTLDGIVNRADYAIRNAQKGKPFNYPVEARFEGATGTGHRLTGRVCDFEFRRL